MLVLLSKFKMHTISERSGGLSWWLKLSFHKADILAPYGVLTK